jgi:hypothetical protein
VHEVPISVGCDRKPVRHPNTGSRKFAIQLAKRSVLAPTTGTSPSPAR